VCAVQRELHGLTRCKTIQHSVELKIGRKRTAWFNKVQNYTTLCRTQNLESANYYMKVKVWIFFRIAHLPYQIQILIDIFSTKLPVNQVTGSKRLQYVRYVYSNVRGESIK